MSGQALTYVEIDIPYCALTYGVAPCAASLTSSPPTGTIKCFNTRATCQDTANIDLEDVTWRFARGAAYLPRDIDIVAASVIGVEFSPAVVSLGEDLGQRASVKVTFKDHEHSDAGAGFDKYHTERGYNPYERGTFWGRFRARHQFLRGQALRWINGFVGDALADMETRHFFIESVEGPRPDGTFTIIAKDCLKFLDGDRAQAPVLSNGFLAAGINASVTSATLSPAGIGNAEYPASGYLCLGGKEVVSFTRVNDALTITRAQRGTTAQSHSAGDRVQLTIVYDADDPADIINDLLTNYTDLPASYIPLATWQLETGTHLNRVYTFTIPEPTAVKELISRIVVQATLALWDDNVNQKLQLQVLRAVPSGADEYSESNVIDGSFRMTEQPDKKVTQVWVYFGQIDPTKRYDDPDNYRATVKVPSTPDEVEGEAIAIKKIFANGIPLTGGSTIAERIGEIHEGRYRTAPRRFGFDLMRGSVDAPLLGGGYQLSWHTLQDATGALESVPVQIIRLKPPSDLFGVEAEEMRFDAEPDVAGTFPISLSLSENNVNLFDTFESLYGAPQAGDIVNVTIQSGVTIGSTSTSTRALDVGTGWPASVVINVTNLGTIQGKGGNGGNGIAAGNGNPGGDGGTALYTRRAINLTNAAGAIKGGGGGGGSGAGKGFPGCGGGGGSGTQPGTGGAGVSGSEAGDPGTAALGGDGGTLNGFDGGDGGDPGQAGSTGVGSGAVLGGAGGDPGNAVDGHSFVTYVSSGTIAGPQVN